MPNRGTGSSGDALVCSQRDFRVHLDDRTNGVYRTESKLAHLATPGDRLAYAGCDLHVQVRLVAVTRPCGPPSVSRLNSSPVPHRDRVKPVRPRGVFTQASATPRQDGLDSPERSPRC